MSKFIFSIEKQELEDKVNLKYYCVDDKTNTIIEESSKNYVLYIKKEDFDLINIKSDSIILTNKKYFNKNNEKVVEIEFKNKEIYDYFKEKLRDAKIETYEEDLPYEHSELISGEKDIFDGKKGEHPKLKTLSVDIETVGDVENQEIVLISSHSFDSEDMNLVYISKSAMPKDKLSSIINHKYDEFKPIFVENEKELLEKFKQDVLEFSPQLLIGWNVIDFDFKVIKQAMKKYDIEFKLSTFEGNTKMRIARDFFGKSNLSFPGLLVFDIIQILKTNFITFDDYKLNTVAKEVLKDEKIDLEDEGDADLGIKNKIHAIENMLQKDPIRLIEYNYKDSLLTSKICEKLELIDLMIQRSITTNTPLLKVQSPIATLDIMYLEQLHKRGFIAPSNFNFSEMGAIEGAFVKDPTPGFYNDVFVLDFKSLYPSIMVTFNIDPFSVGKNGKIEAPNGAKFDSKDGIMASLIEMLLEQRDLAKKENNQIKAHALKITMNSFYGAIASPKSRFHNRDVGEAITSFGREIMKEAVNFVEEKGHKLAVYGDSVTGDTKVWVRKKGSINKQIEIKDIFKLEGEEYEEKQPNGSFKIYKKLKNVETLTMDQNLKIVWKPLMYAMKHRTSKKLYEISYNNSNTITVTQDHSLIDFDHKSGRLFEIEPKIASKIIYNTGFSSKPKNSENYLAKFLGFWIGDGYLDNKNYYIGISAGNDSEEFIEKILKNISYLKDRKFKPTSKGDIKFSSVDLYSVMEQLGFKKEWTSKTKRIPRYIFNQSNSFKYNFIEGLFASDGTIINRGKSSIIRFTSINEDLIKDIQELLMSVGIGSTYFKENKSNTYLSKINNTLSRHLIICSDKMDFFMKNCGLLFDRKNQKYIKSKVTRRVNTKPIKDKKEINGFDDYVYDISVKDTNMFFGNNILLKNTDSIFVSDNKIKFKDLDEKLKFGKNLEKELNKHFEKWVAKKTKRESKLIIEFEKLFSQFFIASKKRYTGFDELSSKLTFTGMEAIRGDWTTLAQDFQIELVKLIFKGAKEDEIKKFILNEVKKLESGEYDSKLVYTKKITKPLVEYTKTTPPHVKAAREVDEFSGKIVKYVMFESGPTHVSLVTKRLESGEKYDYKHYIEKQLDGVSDDLLEHLNIDFKEVIGSKKQKSLSQFF